MIRPDRVRNTGTGTSTLLTGATLVDGRRGDVRLADGRIERIRPHDPTTPAPDPADPDPADPAALMDLDGYLLLPAPGEPHGHLDKALTADLIGNPSGDLAGAIRAWLRHRPTLTHDDIVRRATAAMHTYLAHGATTVRSHVDLGDEVGLRAVHAMLEVRRTFADACTMQLVAFVGVPLTGVAGAAHRALLREALDAGADVVGGCPAFDPDPAGCVDECLGVATAHRLPLDLHVDETLDPEVQSLRMLADAVGDGYPYGVVASHCVSLAAQSPAAAGALAERLARAGVAVVCLPQTNLFLQGRDRTVPGQAGRPRGLAPLEILRAAGVTVAAGGDNLQDPFNLVGRGDPLETAALLVMAGHLSPADAYQAVSAQVRTALGLTPVTLTEGDPADLLAVRAGTLRAAVADADAGRIVFHRGRIVARTRVSREFPVTGHAGTSAEGGAG